MERYAQLWGFNAVRYLIFWDAIEPSRVFALAFDPSPSATLPSEIYLPATRHYPDGWSLAGCDEDRGCSWTWDANPKILQVLTPNQTARVELTITPDG